MEKHTLKTNNLNVQKTFALSKIRVSLNNLNVQIELFII